MNAATTPNKRRMMYEINFESLKDVYGPRGLPGVWDFGKEKEDEYLRYVQDKYGKWVDALLRLNCEKAGLEIAHIDSPGENFVSPSDVIDTWVGEEYKIVLKNKDDVYTLLKILGQALHEHGVDSEKHNEQGLVDRETRDTMFKAMIVDNLLGELYTMVEDVLSDYNTVEKHYGSLLVPDY